MSKETKKYTEHANPRKSFGVSPKKVKHDANTREAEDEIKEYSARNWSEGDYLRHVHPPQPTSKLD